MLEKGSENSVVFTFCSPTTFPLGSPLVHGHRGEGEGFQVGVSLRTLVKSTGIKTISSLLHGIYKVELSLFILLSWVCL